MWRNTKFGNQTPRPRANDVLQFWQTLVHKQSKVTITHFTMATLTETLRPSISGLSHLVEAATALTALVDPSSHGTSSTAPATILVSDDDDSRMKKSDSKSSKKKETFPQRLIDILNDPSLSDIVSWLPHGRSFVIIRPDKFTQQVLPKYLPPVDARASTKYPSFTRKLNRW